jgi:endoglucanase
MRRSLCLSLSLLLLSACATRPPAPQRLSRQPFRAPRAAPLSMLAVEGSRLVNASGDTVTLRGANIGGWLLIEPWMVGLDGQPGIESEKDIWDLMERRFGRDAKLELIREYREHFFTEDDVRALAALGLNAIRVPIWWRAVSDPEYGGDFAYVDNVLAWCAANGMYVILDLHGAPGGQSKEAKIIGERANADLWNQRVFKERTVDWWKTVAERYKGHPAIAGYDLLNEAMSAEMDDLVELYDRLYREIRAIDPSRVLIMEDGLLGFHRLPRPLDMGWSNVVYSLHYYPQNTADAFSAATKDLHRINRSAMYFGVPCYIGEFNSIQLDRGGASSFLRFIEAFDYFGWSWTFWSYKKMEANRDINWGLTGYRADSFRINLFQDSFEQIREAFRALRTERLGTHPLLFEALRQPVRWSRPPLFADNGAMRLGLDSIHLFPAEGTMQYEWGLPVPNIGYWGPGERVAWPLQTSEAGAYELSLNYANNSDRNRARIWLDGVEFTEADLPNTRGWENYRDQALAVIPLTPGRHVIEISQADSGDAFINLRHALLSRTDRPAVQPLERAIQLHPLNAAPLRKGSPLRVEWWNNPPNFGYWKSGEIVSWPLHIRAGGNYRVMCSYSTPSSDTELAILLNGEPVWRGRLAGTGDWHIFKTAETGVISLGPGDHTLAARWETPNANGAGNLRGLMLTREE